MRELHGSDTVYLSELPERAATIPNACLHVHKLPVEQQATTQHPNRSPEGSTKAERSCFALDLQFRKSSSDAIDYARLQLWHLPKAHGIVAQRGRPPVIQMRLGYCSLVVATVQVAVHPHPHKHNVPSKTRIPSKIVAYSDQLSPEIGSTNDPCHQSSHTTV